MTFDTRHYDRDEPAPLNMVDLSNPLLPKKVKKWCLKYCDADEMLGEIGVVKQKKYLEKLRSKGYDVVFYDHYYKLVYKDGPEKRKPTLRCSCRRIKT